MELPAAESGIRNRPELVSPERRLHPLTLVFAGWKELRWLIFSSIPTFFFITGLGASKTITIIILGSLFVSGLAQTLAHYFTFTYRLEGGELITRQGLLARTERHIPLERVQEIRLSQNMMHRFCGVVEAHVETAGGGGPEASLSVLSRAEVEALREAVFARLAAVKSEGYVSATSVHTDSRAIVRQLKLRDLVLAGLTSNHLVSAFVLLGVLWAWVDDFLPESIYQRATWIAFGTLKGMFVRDAVTAVIVTAAGLLAVTLVSIVFSVVGSVMLFYGFTLSRSGEDLHRAYGLFTHRASSLPRRRIQVLEIEEGWLRRWRGLATLRGDVVGGRAEDDGDDKERESGRDVLIPVLPRAEVEGLLPIFFPDLEEDEAEWRRVSRLAIRRETLQGALFCALLAGAAIFYYRNLAGLWLLALVPLIYWINLRRYDHLGYALGQVYLRTRRGWLGRSTHIVPLSKVQALAVRQTVLDRRLGLATLTVDTAGQAYTGGGPSISNLPVEEAFQVARMIAQRAAVTKYR
jgi:putative membrane protein